MKRVRVLIEWVRFRDLLEQKARAATAAGDREYARWARGLAKEAYRAIVRGGWR